MLAIFRGAIYGDRQASRAALAAFTAVFFCLLIHDGFGRLRFGQKPLTFFTPDNLLGQEHVNEPTLTFFVHIGVKPFSNVTLDPTLK
jgi:hypothetical protein